MATMTRGYEGIKATDPGYLAALQCLFYTFRIPKFLLKRLL
jgi:hypothetical protein